MKNLESKMEGFQIHSDINANGQVVHFITSEDDPSVGIYGERISPNFVKMSRLEAWWNRYGKKVSEIYWTGPSDQDEMLREIKEATKGWI